MKRTQRLSIVISLLTYMIVTPAICAEGNRNSSDPSQHARLRYDEAQKDVREKRLSVALSDILGMGVHVQDDEVILKGSKTHIDEAMNRLNNFDILRQKVMPLNPEAVHTQVTPSANFNSWHECIIALGINPDLMSNFTIHTDLDEAGTLKIPYTSKPDKSLADVYITNLRELSPYLDWICKHNHDIIKETPSYKIVHYGLLREHLCKLESQQEPTGMPEELQSRLPVTTVLKRLTAAAGEDLSLVQSARLGEYHVRTVMLGRANADQHVSLIPTIEIVIDYSLSMGEPSSEGSVSRKIDVVNKSIPTLITQFRDALKAGESLKINVKKFNHEMHDHASFTLKYGDSAPIQWSSIAPAGGTDLTKVGNLLRLEHPDERKVVVAFTDGKHEAESSIEANMSELKRLQQSGLFADLNFHRVGVKDSQNDKYFPQVSAIFAGSFEEQNTIEQFCQKVTSRIPYLLESSTPIILSLGDEKITVRVPDAHPDIHTTERTVNVASVVTHRGVEHFIVPKNSNTSSIQAAAYAPSEPAIDSTEALQARIKQLEAELAQARLSAKK